MQKHTPRWDILHVNGKWSWRRILEDGTFSPPTGVFNSFDDLLHNATAAGFVPTQHHWMLEDDTSVTYFEPGQEPRTLQK